LHRIDTGADAPDGLDLMLLGCGNIGRALVGQVLDRQTTVFERFGVRARIVAIADRTGYVLEPAGVERSKLDAAIEHKAGGGKLATLDGAVATEDPTDMVRAALEYRLSRPILVDVSDADGAQHAFVEALERGCDVATANKKPLAGAIEDYRSLHAAARKAGRIIRAEATVGAGLPVVDTLEMLLATGDTVVRAEGCLSGTLGFLMSALESGTTFSAAVREAVERGYTEPDPVADLSGVDVARKAIILARLAGLPSANAEVQLTGLVDASLSGMDVEALLSELESLDVEYANKVDAARKDGMVLRFVAKVEQNSITVGPVAVPKDSPLGGLQGSDNMIVFTSERYNDRPLVITGPGAGVDVTAMGVLGDILRIAAERRSP